MFPSLVLTWASECKRPLGRPLSLYFQVFDQRKARTKAGIIERVIVVDVRRQSSQPTWTFSVHRGARFKTLSHSQELRRSIKMRSTRQGFVAPNGGESLTLQQIMETMQALQETVVASRADQERIRLIWLRR